MIHPKALVDDSEAIGCETNVWAFAHVMAGARIGDHCSVGDHAFVESGAVVGNRVTIKNSVLIWEGVVIEDDVFVGPAVVFTNDRFPRSPRAAIASSKYSVKSNWLEETLVRQGCSIGASATIGPGIVLGPYCMIGAGAVVTHDVEPYSLVVGAPARRIDSVCSCGQRLFGHYLRTDCMSCGESATSRDPLKSARTTRA